MGKWWKGLVLAACVLVVILKVAGVLNAYQPATIQDWNIGESALQFRTFVNNALAGLQSSFSGVSFPSNPVAGQLFYNSSTKTLYQYSGSVWTSFGANAPTYHFADLGTNVPLSFAGIGMCVDCSVASPCTGSGGGALFRSTGSQFNCSNPGALDISKLLQPAQGDYDMGPHVLSGNVENVLDATKYVGSDLGDQVTAAAAALPTVIIGGNSYHIGRVYIPQAASVYSYSHTMQTDPTVLISCEQGTLLNYTGTTDGVNQQSPHELNNTGYAMGGVENCQWITPILPAANVHVIHTGDALGLHYKNLHIDGYKNTGDAAIELTNKIYFTEHDELTGLILTNNTEGVVFEKNCEMGAMNCGNSLEYTKLDMYCQTASGGDCIEVLTGGTVLHSIITGRANINGSGSKFIHVDSMSGFYQNNLSMTAEGDSSTGRYFLYTDSGGIGQLDGRWQLSNLTNSPTVPVQYQEVQTEKFTAAGTYTFPSITGGADVLIWGAGGAGGGGNGSGGGLGGGQGAFTHCFLNGPALGTLTIVVGSHGVAGAINNSGGTGGDSSVTFGSISCTSHGGTGGGTFGGAAGAGGTSSAGAGPALSSNTGASGSGGAGGAGGVPGYCPCGGAGGAMSAVGHDGSDGLVQVFSR